MSKVELNRLSSCSAIEQRISEVSRQEPSIERSPDRCESNLREVGVGSTELSSDFEEGHTGEDMGQVRRNEKKEGVSPRIWYQSGTVVAWEPAEWVVMVNMVGCCKKLKKQLLILMLIQPTEVNAAPNVVQVL